MDPYIVGAIRDNLFSKLPLRDIRALRSTSSQFVNTNPGLVITLEVNIDGIHNDIEDAVYDADLQSGDYTKKINKSNIADTLIYNFDLLKYAIIPKYDLLTYIRRHRVADTNTVIRIRDSGPLSAPIDIMEDSVSDTVELAFPVWKLKSTIDGPDETIYIYQLYNTKKLKDRYKLSKQQFAKIYSDIIYSRLLRQVNDKHLLLVSRQEDDEAEYAYYRYNDGVIQLEGNLFEDSDPEDFQRYIMDDMNSYDIYDASPFYIGGY